MDLREKTFKTFQSNFGDSGVKATLPFTCSPEKSYDSSQMEEEKLLHMMLAYTADTIFVYEVSNANNRSLTEVGLDLRCKYKMHSAILSVNYFTTSEDNKTLFLAILDDLKVATLSFNYGLSAVETLGLHRLSTRDTLSLLSASTYKLTKPILRVDVSNVRLTRWSRLRCSSRFLSLLCASAEKNRQAAVHRRTTACLGLDSHPERVPSPNIASWRALNFSVIL